MYNCFVCNIMKFNSKNIINTFIKNLNLCTNNREEIKGQVQFRGPTIRWIDIWDTDFQLSVRRGIRASHVLFIRSTDHEMLSFWGRATARTIVLALPAACARIAADARIALVRDLPRIFPGAVRSFVRD